MKVATDEEDSVEFLLSTAESELLSLLLCVDTDLNSNTRFTSVQPCDVFKDVETKLFLSSTIWDSHLQSRPLMKQNNLLENNHSQHQLLNRTAQIWQDLSFMKGKIDSQLFVGLKASSEEPRLAHSMLTDE